MRGSGDEVGTRLAYGTKPLKPARVDTKCYSAHGFHGSGHIPGRCLREIETKIETAASLKADRVGCSFNRLLNL